MKGDNRTVVVTGGGSGLGEAFVRRFARAGFQVGIADIDEQRAQAVMASVHDEGTRGFALGMDVTRGSDWDRLYGRVVSEWGGLQVLINNAGVAAAGRLEDTPLDDWHWVVETDLFSVVRGCHRFLPLLRHQGRGHLVNIASFAGMMPVPEVSAYATAKAAVVAMSEQLRVDLAGSGVGVTVVCPAYVKTRLLESFRSRDEGHQRMAERWMERSPVSPEDVADQVFEAVQSGRFLVLTHRETRWLWRLRRWAPERFHRLVVKGAQRLKARSKR